MTTQITPRGVDEGDDDASVINLTGSEDESEIEDEMTYYPEVKRELQDSGVSPQDSGDSGVPPKDVGLRRSSRTQTQAKIFSPKIGEVKAMMKECVKR